MTPLLLISSTSRRTSDVCVRAVWPPVERATQLEHKHLGSHQRLVQREQGGKKKYRQQVGRQDDRDPLRYSFQLQRPRGIYPPPHYSQWHRWNGRRDMEPQPVLVLLPSWPNGEVSLMWIIHHRLHTHTHNLPVHFFSGTREDKRSLRWGDTHIIECIGVYGRGGDVKPRGR